MDYPDELDLTRFLLWFCRILWRRRGIIISVTLLAGALGAFVSKVIMKPVFTADTVMLTPADNKAGALGSLLGATGLPMVGLSQSSDPANNALAILKSRSCATSVVRALGLQKEYNLPQEQQAVETLRSSVKIDTGKEGQIVLTASAGTARLAADIANTFVRVLQNSRQIDESSDARRHLHFVETQLLHTKEELKQAEDALRGFQQHNQLVTVDADTEETVKRMAQLESDLASTRIGLHETRERLHALQPRLVEQARTEGAPSISDTGEVEDLRSKLADKESALMAARTAYTDAHPEVMGLRADIAALRAQLKQQMEKSVSAASRGAMPGLIDLEVASVAGDARETALNQELARLRGEMKKLPGTALAFTRLSREVKVKDAIYEMLLQEYYKAKISAAQSAPPLQVLDPAEPPLHKSGPRAKLNTILALILGLVFGCALAFLTDALSAYRGKAARSRTEKETRSRRELDRAGRE
ncbi:MAG TPA: GNVR domain-containing protein [Armatimonadota bacterium]|nr:GNVR domain-containing protein [Armatimonadota bacterium]